MSAADVVPAFKRRGYLVLGAHGRTIKAGRPVGACTKCAALVEEADQQSHVRWHLRVEAS